MFLSKSIYMIDLQLEKKIKELSKKNNISIRQLCLKIEMTEQGFGTALKNNTLKIETLARIAECFNVPINYFFGGDSDDKKEIILGLEFEIKDLKELLIKHQKQIIEFHEQMKYLRNELPQLFYKFMVLKQHILSNDNFTYKTELNNFYTKFNDIFDYLDINLSLKELLAHTTPKE